MTLHTLFQRAGATDGHGIAGHSRRVQTATTAWTTTAPANSTSAACFGHPTANAPSWTAPPVGPLTELKRPMRTGWSSVTGAPRPGAVVPQPVAFWQHTAHSCWSQQPFPASPPPLRMPGSSAPTRGPTKGQHSRTFVSICLPPLKPHPPWPAAGSCADHVQAYLLSQPQQCCLATSRCGRPSTHLERPSAPSSTPGPAALPLPSSLPTGLAHPPHH